MKYDFGRNWKKFNTKIQPDRMRFAVEGINHLLTHQEIQDSSILDVGSGSGIHAAAFLELGAKNIQCIDCDLDSVSATNELLSSSSAYLGRWKCSQMDILAPHFPSEQKFDIVYAWGSLHHTGDMIKAIANCIELIEDGGLFVLALYRKTKICEFWKIEKRIYSRAPWFLRLLFDVAYMTFHALVLLIKNRIWPPTYYKKYNTSRGMDYITDVRDWLGGYPYQSTTPNEIAQLMESFEMTLVRDVLLERIPLGFTGTGCDQFVYRKVGKSNRK